MSYSKIRFNFRRQRSVTVSSLSLSPTWKILRPNLRCLSSRISTNPIGNSGIQPFPILLRSDKDIVSLESFVNVECGNVRDAETGVNRKDDEVLHISPVPGMHALVALPANLAHFVTCPIEPFQFLISEGKTVSRLIGTDGGFYIKNAQVVVDPFLLLPHLDHPAEPFQFSARCSRPCIPRGVKYFPIPVVWQCNPSRSRRTL